MTELPNRDTPKNHFRPALIAALAGISFFLTVFFLLSPEASDKSLNIALSEPLSPALSGSLKSPQAERTSRYDFRLSESDTFYHFMSVLNVPGAEIQEILERARPVYDLKQLKKDSVLRAFTKQDRLERIEYKFGDYETLIAEREEGGSFRAFSSELPHEMKETLISGTIENSLYEDGLKAGADAQAVMELSDIFAWDIDFASDIRKGDTFKIVSQVLYVEGVPVRTGRILGAEMVNGGKKYSAVYFEGKESGSYYDSDGKSLRRTLLKSPLRFRRITSYFSRGRFHPILKKYRPHHGIDYGAPSGTPVESAGSGRVAYAGWKKGYGNFVEIRHNNNYSTAYGHLSRIAKGIRKGSKVDQGDLIGNVGSTGISTGPHLHYEVKLAGRLINPLSIKAVPDRAVSRNDARRFASVKEEIRRKLSGEISIASNPAPVNTASSK
ncbi:MAG: peptidoglycan DD-metalloendopeptidase family protein [Deltaproteobacteria bacterium]|nr:peptidoglycan DD-metalloendopeptidase family protein [Deltaproteobacteria bacterium]